ncbi:hypothetical protein CEXT_475751 [Caerostris extrusa]|uniref:Uncharacterized protein n=1 Tax=Caerostris extrusa TaxID=172846 RepID=A0AAV4XGZ0_CAEEX|nr:hypothetical protein CEXT_475751 [Caerostris extrusa]
MPSLPVPSVRSVISSRRRGSNWRRSNSKFSPSFTSRTDRTSPPLAREVALEALRRTQGGIPEEEGDEPDEDEAGNRDDYYARTSEIIAFAEPGE